LGFVGSFKGSLFKPTCDCLYHNPADSDHMMTYKSWEVVQLVPGKTRHWLGE